MYLSLYSRRIALLHISPIPALNQAFNVLKRLPSMFDGKIGRLKGKRGKGQRGKDEPVETLKSITNFTRRAERSKYVRLVKP